MPDLNFLAAGAERKRGLKRLLTPFRKVARRLMLPILQKQLELFSELFQEQARVGEILRKVELNQQARLERAPQDYAEQCALGWHIADVRQHHERVRHDHDRLVVSVQQAQAELSRITEAVAHATRQLAALQALAWDHVAMGRRLATIEDRVVDLYDQQPSGTADESELTPTVPMPFQRLKPLTQAG